MDGYRPIQNYGVIGDLNTVALVGKHGSIDLLSFPTFDSPTIFAALLDHQKGGHFQIMPQLDEAESRQMYLPDTNCLLTRFLDDTGVAEITDFMPLGRRNGGHHTRTVIRRVSTVRGEVNFRMVCAPRFDYARGHHSAEANGNAVLFTGRGDAPMAVRLRSTVPMRVEGGDAHAEFRLSSGESAAFILEQVLPGMSSPSDAPDYVDEAFMETVTYWQRWVERSTYQGRWREMVNRSALVLKLLTSETHGSLIAAPTFGLPEKVGGERNWDYRYTWIRDASFSLQSLLRLGYTDEAKQFMQWIENRCNELNPDGSLQVMYGIDGRHNLAESILPHLEGYRGSSPVRIGNGAFDQLQLDIYGELMDSVFLYDAHGEPVHYDLWRNLVSLIDWVCANWRQPDEGIWEVRGGRQDFLSSRVMCWVAVDRGIRLSLKRSLPAPVNSWMATRNMIYQEIFQGFWNPRRRAFIQHLGSRSMDASNLLMPLMSLISPTDPRWVSTLHAIEEDLAEDSLLFRYKQGESAADGFDGGEGTFCMCTFWYVDSLAQAGEVDKARLIFEKMLGYANHLGLYAEELGPRAEHLGNFPQAFTHLGLITSAFNLDRAINQRLGRR